MAVEGKTLEVSGTNLKLPYYDKGGHLRRSLFQKVMRALGDPPKGLIEMEWLTRRNMPRHPRNGKR